MSDPWQFGCAAVLLFVLSCARLGEGDSIGLFGLLYDVALFAAAALSARPAPAPAQGEG